MDDEQKLALFAVCRRAITKSGGAAALAARLTSNETGKPLHRQAVYQWQQVPATRVLDVEAISGVSRYELRPDVFGGVKNEL